jgi:hypothetical protein
MPSPVPVEMVARVVTACRSARAARAATAAPAGSAVWVVMAVPEAWVGCFPAMVVLAVTVVMG